MTPPSESAPFQSLSVETLAQRLASGDDLQLIDVREPQELELASLQGFTNLPLSQFATWANTIHSQFDADKETAVLCHHGVRSAQMCGWLAQQGFTQLLNITGGIDAYSVVVDRSIPRY
jgi:rhodanese-related sulfurtransferase